MSDFSFFVEGRPLAEIGLEGAVIRHADGREEPLAGLALRGGETIADALRRQLPAGAALLFRDDHSIATCRASFDNLRPFRGFSGAALVKPKDEPFTRG